MKDYAFGVLPEKPRKSSYKMTDAEMCVREKDGSFESWKTFPCERIGRYMMLILYCCDLMTFWEMEVYGIFA